MNQYHYNFAIWKSVAAQILHQNHAALGHFFDASYYSKKQSLQETPLMLPVGAWTWKNCGNPAFYLFFFFLLKLYDNFQSAY